MKKARGKRALNSTVSFGNMRQTSIMEHLQSTSRPKRSKSDVAPILFGSGSEVLPRTVGDGGFNLKSVGQSSMNPCYRSREEEIGADWEYKVDSLLHKHFGHSSLKSFQKEALSAWLAHQDCLVLAATGSGKSMCFQIPALLTGKVVIVISPLISLMHDQCFKLAKHGVSACFLGSGQPDSSVEQRAMDGMYGIVYVCPETILRLIKPLQRLAENRGIALFAIDEVHCVSKWGHDFRPDYRRMSVLRENFSASTLEFLKFDVPLMALTATATLHVREDILKSLHMSQDTKIIVTSFFRPNLRFAVKHSRTSSTYSYEMDFSELIDIYTKKRMPSQQKYNVKRPDMNNATNHADSEEERVSFINVNDSDDDNFDGSDDAVNLKRENDSNTSREKQMSVEYLEDELDVFESVNDWDVAFGEFQAQYPAEDRTSQPFKSEDTSDVQEHLEHGPTIIYAPTRKQTVSIAKYLCKSGVKAAAYNAQLPKSHLRQVHKEFHENALQVVVATIAFGMGIDKLNVRRIIHYGWPQSLEAYYQEAGRAGRDGKLADCVLYANLSRVPTLLPNRRSEEQAKQAYKMLSDCYRYGMNTSICRAKVLVGYFGEAFTPGKCLSCDFCVNGAPEMQNVREEANTFMQILTAFYEEGSYGDDSYQSYEEVTSSDFKQRRSIDQPNITMFIRKIREQSQKYSATDQLWWRGLARILEAKGYIREKGDKTHVQIKFPEPTKLGLEFMQLQPEQPFYVYPEADMLLSNSKKKPNSSFEEWGKGWADPEIRRQRLGFRRGQRKPRQKQFRKPQMKPNTVRGRLTAKLSH